MGVTGHQSEIIELVLTYGFGGMDLNVVEFATRARLKGVEYARRLIDSAKLKLGSFALPLDWDTDDETFAKDLQKLPEYAQAAIAAGCTRCIATVAPASDKRPYHENFEFHKRRFQEICQALEPAGVRFGVGFQAAEYLRKNQAFQFVHDLDALTLLLNMVAAPNIGLLLDIWDVVVGGGSLDSVRKLPVKPDCGRTRGRSAAACRQRRDRREIPLVARRRRRADRHHDVVGLSQVGGLRRSGYAAALAWHFPEPPSRPGGQAGGRGHGQGLAGRRIAHWSAVSSPRPHRWTTISISGIHRLPCFTGKTA